VFAKRKGIRRLFLKKNIMKRNSVSVREGDCLFLNWSEIIAVPEKNKIWICSSKW